MKTGRYLIFITLLAVSCSKNTVDDTRVPITFSTGFYTGLETRAFLNSADISTSGTEFSIYGYNGSSWIIDGETATCDTNGDLTLDMARYWESGKSYSFFSWLGKDKYGKSVSGIDATNVKTNRKLTVSAKAFDFVATDNDFDFCYSDVVYRPGTKPDHSDVKFNLKHLYTAVSFSAQNYTGSAITLKEVTVVGLKNKKSATIAFADDSTTVDYPSTSVTCSWTDGIRSLYKNTSGTAIAADSGYANVVGTSLSTTEQYYMFWPQTSAELACTGWTSNATAPTGGAYLKVVYNQGGSDKTRYAKFPEYNDGTDNLGWPAGSKQNIELSFSDTQFTLILKAAPWDYAEPEINYGEGLTSSDITPMSFDSSTCTVDAANHKVYFKGGSPITASFKVAKPLNATWVISKEGDYDAFELDNAATSEYGNGKDCNYGTIDGGDASFTLYPKVSDTGKTYSIQLTFSVRYSNGESVCIDEDIQPVTWTFILID